MSVQNEVDNKQKAISDSQKEMKDIERKLREVKIAGNIKSFFRWF